MENKNKPNQELLTIKETAKLLKVNPHRVYDLVRMNQVIAKYAGICALGCFGIVGMAMVNMKDGIAKLLTRDNIRKGVFVSVKNNKITIDFHIIVSYGVSISTVASNLMESVKYRVEEFTSLEVERINIYVEGVKDIG